MTVPFSPRSPLATSGLPSLSMPGFGLGYSGLPKVGWFLFQDQNDLVQDVLLAAFQKIREHKFHGESSLGTWLIGILSHKIADYWDRNSRESGRIARTENIELTATQPAIDRIPDPAPHPDVAVETRENLAMLPKEHRVVLLLNVTEGWTTDEIAALLKMPSGTVGRILWEAKHLLRGNPRALKKLAPGRD